MLGVWYPPPFLTILGYKRMIESMWAGCLRRKSLEVEPVTPHYIPGPYETLNSDGRYCPFVGK